MRKINILLSLLLLFGCTTAANAQSETSAYWEQKGNADLVNGNFKMAIQAFDKAIALDEKNVSAYLGRASAKVSLNMFESAYYDLDKCLKLRPQDASIYYQRGRVAALQGKNLDAMMDYTKAIEIDPSMGSAYIQRGKLYLKFKTTDKACTDFKHAKQYGMAEANKLLADNCN